RGYVDAELAENMDTEFRNLLQDRLNLVKQKPLPYNYQQMEKEWMELRKSEPEDFIVSPETGISKETFEKVAKAITTLPKGFKPIKQIEKQFKQRNEIGRASCRERV